MRMVRCALPEGGAVTVGAGEQTRMFRGGDLADLDQVIAPTCGDRPALTLEEALGPHVQHFAPAVDASIDEPSVRPDAADQE